LPSAFAGCELAQALALQDWPAVKELTVNALTLGLRHEGTPSKTRPREEARIRSKTQRIKDRVSVHEAMRDLRSLWASGVLTKQISGGNDGGRNAGGEVLVSALGFNNSVTEPETTDPETTEPKAEKSRLAEVGAEMALVGMLSEPEPPPYTSLPHVAAVAARLDGAREAARRMRLALESEFGSPHI
jgi:hypothetical protein